MSVREQIYDLASGVLNVPKKDLRLETPFEEYAADSLDLVEFMFAVQEQFAITFDTSELDHLKCLNDLIAAVESKANAKKS